MFGHPLVRLTHDHHFLLHADRGGESGLLGRFDEVLSGGGSGHRWGGDGEMKSTRSTENVKLTWHLARLFHRGAERPYMAL